MCKQLRHTTPYSSPMKACMSVTASTSPRRLPFRTSRCVFSFPIIMSYQIYQEALLQTMKDKVNRGNAPRLVPLFCNNQRSIHILQSRLFRSTSRLLILSAAPLRISPVHPQTQTLSQWLLLLTAPYVAVLPPLLSLLLSPTLYPPKSDICWYFLALFLPPFSVFLKTGCGADFLINILLPILGWNPVSFMHGGLPASMRCRQGRIDC